MDDYITYNCTECGKEYKVHMSRVRFMRPPMTCTTHCRRIALSKIGRQAA